MSTQAFETFIAEARKQWAAYSPETLQKYRRLMETLVKDPATLSWLKTVLENSPEGKELYRDPERGFVFLAYTENRGRYRVPHDHGHGWVVYSIASGEVEMKTYRRSNPQQQGSSIVQHEAYVMKPGDCQTYAPGDIHDTRGLAETSIILRFTSCDLREEDRQGRMTRYPDFEERG